MFAVELGQLLSEEIGLSSIQLVAAIISFVVISLYAMCYFLAKKHRVFILVALIFFSFDTLFLIWIITFGFEPGILLDVAFHVWIMYYLIVGTKMWSDLKKLPPDEETAWGNGQTGWANGQTAWAGGQTEYSNTQVPVMPTPPIRPPSPNGRIIFSQPYGNWEIVVQRAFSTTELIVNGIVFAEKKGIVETSYTLDAYVENTYIKVTMDLSGQMELYVNGDLLASTRRFF